MKMRTNSLESNKTEATRGVTVLEHGIRQLRSRECRTDIWAVLAALSITAGRFDRATDYANQLLAYGNGPMGRRSGGDALHHGNLCLGRVALRAGDIGAAKAYLLQAGRVSGSPVLESFGPNMLLAKELLEVGQREIGRAHV